ncbi:hypothetical protein ACFL0P_00970 [Candidatus Omnitrophota bacterium]
MKNRTHVISTVARVNRYLIMMSLFFLVYFLLKTNVDIILFLLALSYASFALLSYRHLIVTNALAVELERAKIALKDVSSQAREMHPD